MPQKPILVVDDNPAQLKVTKDILESEGCKVLTALGVDEAIDTLKYFHPFLVLANVFMPGASGIDLARRIKRDPLLRGVKVLLMTHLWPGSGGEKAKAKECDGILRKPINAQTVTGQIDNFMQLQTGEI